jgi:predicted CoA-binding protein
MAMPTREQLRRLYETTRTIAVVGASAREGRPGNRIPRYLQGQGYRIVPVNPRGGTILGEPAVRSLADIEGPVDVVEVFRPPEEAETIARQAIAIGAPVLWFQPGTNSAAGVRQAEDAGLTVVRELCMGTTHGALGLGPGPPPAPPGEHE